MTTTPAARSYRASAILASCQMADSFKGLSRNRGTQAGTTAFQNALDELVTLAWSQDDQTKALATTFASRVESSGPETANLVHQLMEGNGTPAPADFLARMEAQVGETARSFMVVTGLPVSAICPSDYATLSRFWLHLVNLRRG